MEEEGRNPESEGCDIRKNQPATAGFGNGRGPWVKESGEPLESGERQKKLVSPLEPPEGNTTLVNILILTQWYLFQTPDFQNYKVIICGFEPLICDNLL